MLKYHALFFHNLGKMSQNLSSAAVVIGSLTPSLPYLSACTMAGGGGGGGGGGGNMAILILLWCYI